MGRPKKESVENLETSKKGRKPKKSQEVVVVETNPAIIEDKPIEKKINQHKASDGPFEDVWQGMKRCLYCGFAFATQDSEEMEFNKKKNRMVPKYPNEKPLHTTFHAKFKKTIEECIETQGTNYILEYAEYRDMLKNMSNNFDGLKECDITDDLTLIKTSLPMFNNISQYISSKLSSLYSLNNSGLLDLLDKTEKILNSFNAEVLSLDCLFNYEELLDGSVKNLIELNSGIVSQVYISGSDLVKDCECIIEYIEKNALSGDLCDFKSVINKLKETLENVSNLITNISSKLNKLPISDNLKTIFLIEYNRSLRLWDFCKTNPKFDDYCKILWNTPKFIKYLSKYLPEMELLYIQDKMKCNRQLYDFKFPEAPFYFGRVIESEVCANCRLNDSICQSCDSIESCEKCYKCEKCKNCSVEDLSYADSLENENDDETVDEIIDEKTHDAMMDSVGKALNSKLK